MQALHGWRRKVGVLALVVACLLGCLWVRSLFALDIAGCDWGTTTLDPNTLSDRFSKVVRSSNSVRAEARSMDGMLLLAFSMGNEPSEESSRFPSIGDPGLPMSGSWCWYWPLAYQRFAYDEDEFDEPTYPVSHEPWPCNLLGLRLAWIPTDSFIPRAAAIPYWMLVWPVALAAAWLLLVGQTRPPQVISSRPIMGCE